MPLIHLAFALALCVAATARAALPEPVMSRLNAAGIPPDAMAALVVRLSDGETLLAHQPDRAMQPASTLKLVTSLAALETLGPTYRGRTELRARGPLAGDRLEGDLVLKGYGDVDFDWRALERLLQLARQKGIREVSGDLVLDLTFFTPPRTDVGVPPFDEAPEFRYNVIPDALMLNTNLLLVDLHSDDSTVRASITPEIDRVSIASEMKLVDRACEDWEDGWIIPSVAREARGGLRIRLQGEFPRHCSAATSINVIERTAFVERLFRAMWRRLGGSIQGRVRQGEMPADARLVAQHESRTLAELMRDVNKRSDNPITRVVYLTLGALSAAPSSEPTARRADMVLREWLQRRGIDPTGIVLENGSGLSRSERISASQLVAVLKAGVASDWAPEFLSSLPIVAMDGGMRRRLGDTPAARRSRIKTGTLRDVTAVAGYVKDEAGATHLVVAMVNHPLAKRHVARPIVDSLLEWVARRRATRLPAPSS